MKTFLVVNPQSGNGDTGKRWGELQARLLRQLPDAKWEFTKGPMDAARLTRDALKQGFECVVAVGGDGTTNEVVNGFFENGKVLNPAAALGVLPRGTGGDFRRTFGWSTDFDEAVARLAAGKTRPFDVGELEFLAHDGTTQKRYFANICSFGVSGLVDREVNTTTKALGGKLSFMLGSVKGLLKYSDRPVLFSLDGGAPRTVPVTTLAVANGKYFGGGMKVAPEADVSDGKFDVTVWSGYGLKDFALKQGAIYSGAHVKWKGTTTYRCVELKAESEHEVLIDCDGEQPGKLPCRMRILPGAIKLCG